MKKKLFDYLANKDILKLVSMNESFFLYKRLDKKVKLDRNILEINYLNNSPFPVTQTMIVSIYDKNDIYLWFYKKDTKHYLPEALLLFRLLINNYSNGIFIFKDSVIKILIIKDNCLVSSFLKKRLSEFDIQLMKEEFLLKDNQTYIFELEEYNSLLQKGFSTLKVSDFLQLLNISIDFKSLINRALLNLSLPLLISSILVIVSLSGYYFYVEDKHEKLYKIYQTKQKSLSKIKREVSKYEDSIEVFNTIKNEFVYSNKIVALFSITQEVKESNMSLFYVRMSEENIEFEVRTEDSLKIPKFTEKLFSLGIFSSVKNSSTQNLPHGKVKATMQAILKAK